MKKTRIFALVLALAMCLALTACGTAKEAPAAGGTEKAAALKLGMIGPLTGPAALYGTAANNGAKIAVDEINAKGGLQIEFNPQDDEHDAEKSVNAYNALKDWGAQAIVGCVTTSPCVAVAAVANTDRMFMLTPSASSPTVTEGNDNVFQLCFSDPSQGSESAKYIFDNKLADKVAVIYNNSDAYSTGIYQNFQKAADEMGLNVVSVTTFTDDTANDFTVQLTAAQKAGAELVFMPIYYTPASLILQQAKSMGYNASFFGCDGMDGILSMKGFDAKLAEGVMLLTPFSADAQDELTKSFVASYQKAYNEIPSQFAADGYDCVYAIYNAVQKSGIDVATAKPADVCEALIKTFTSSDFSMSGITGENMKWNENGEVTKAPRVYVIQNGVYAPMK